MRHLGWFSLMLLSTGCSAPSTPPAAAQVVPPQTAPSSAASAPSADHASPDLAQTAHGNGWVMDHIDQESHGDGVNNVVLLPSTTAQGHGSSGPGHTIHQVAHGAHATNVVVLGK